jgi:hypothetical protein
MVGSATLTIARSTTVMRNAMASSEKARQRRTSPGTAATCCLSSFLWSTEVMPASDFLVMSLLVKHWPGGKFTDEFWAPLVLHVCEAAGRRAGGRMTAR